MAKRAAIILSGGRSKRFQNARETWQDKALVELFGKPLLIHAIKNVQEVVDEVVICVNNEKRKAQYSDVLTKHGLRNSKLLVDEQRNQLGGPIMGILTGLKATQADHCFTLPSDMPLLQPRVIEHMFDQLKDSHVVVPMWPNGRLETLTMVLEKPEALEIAKTLCHLKRPRSDDIIRGALNIFFVSIVSEISAFDPPLKSFTNINSQSDLASLQPRQAQGTFTKSLRLNLGELSMTKLRLLQDASTLFNESNLFEASKVFSSCANQLEKEGSHFWAAISRENEGKSLLKWSKEQNEAELAKEQLFNSKKAFLKAIDNYESESKIYENFHVIFLAERTKSNENWCEALLEEQLRLK